MPLLPPQPPATSATPDGAGIDCPIRVFGLPNPTKASFKEAPDRSHRKRQVWASLPTRLFLMRH